MDAYDTNRWVGLFGAEVGASGVLAVPIFVAVSIKDAQRAHEQTHGATQHATRCLAEQHPELATR